MRRALTQTNQLFYGNETVTDETECLISYATKEIMQWNPNITTGVDPGFLRGGD